MLDSTDDHVMLQDADNGSDKLSHHSIQKVDSYSGRNFRMQTYLKCQFGHCVSQSLLWSAFLKMNQTFNWGFWYKIKELYKFVALLLAEVNFSFGDMCFEDSKESQWGSSLQGNILKYGIILEISASWLRIVTLVWAFAGTIWVPTSPAVQFPDLGTLHTLHTLRASPLVSAFTSQQHLSGTIFDTGSLCSRHHHDGAPPVNLLSMATDGIAVMQFLPLEYFGLLLP